MNNRGQKCKFRPAPVGANAHHDLGLLTKVYEISPKLYRRQLATALKLSAADVEKRSRLVDSLVASLKDWGFDPADGEKLRALTTQIGL